MLIIKIIKDIIFKLKKGIFNLLSSTSVFNPLIFGQFILFSYLPTYITCIYCIVASLLLVICYLVKLYLIHKFSTKDIKISEVLPDFIIKELEFLKSVGSSKIMIKECKKLYYFFLTTYLIIFLISILSYIFLVKYNLLY